MSLIFLIRNISLMAYYFGFATLLFWEDDGSSFMIQSFLIIIFCLLLSYFLNTKTDAKIIRFIPLAGILLCVFFTKSTLGVIGLIFPAIYLLFLTVKKIYYINFDFDDTFKKLSLCILFALLISIIDNTTSYFLKVSIKYFFIYFVFGIYLIRLLRHDKEIYLEKKFCIINFLSLLVIVLFGIIFSSRIFINFTRFLIYKVYYLLILVLLIPIYLLGYIIEFILNIFHISYKQNVLMNKLSEVFGKMPGTSTTNLTATETNVFFIKGIAIVFCILFFIFILLKFLSKKTLKTDYKISGITEYKSIENMKKTPSKMLAPSYFGDNSTKIRFWYTKFLNLCNKNEITIRMFDDSERIKNRASIVFDELKADMDSLREKYIIARYSNKELTTSEVNLVKSIYKKLKKINKNQKKD